MFASVGCAAIELIAPTTSSSGSMFSTCPNLVGPGPWAVHVPPKRITVICVGGSCTFLLSSVARLLIVTCPAVVRRHVKLHAVVPVAALKVAPPSTDTSTWATVPPPASLAVPVMLTVVPIGTPSPALGNVIVEIGGVPSLIVTVTCAGGSCTFPLLSTARLLIVADPASVGIHVKLHAVVPVAALKLGSEERRVGNGGTVRWSESL